MILKLAQKTTAGVKEVFIDNLTELAREKESITYMVRGYQHTIAFDNPTLETIDLLNDEGRLLDTIYRKPQTKQVPHEDEELAFGLY